MGLIPVKKGQQFTQPQKSGRLKPVMPAPRQPQQYQAPQIQSIQPTQPIQQPPQTLLQKIGNFAKPMVQAGKETGAAFYDTALRTSPLETVRNIYGGVQGLRNGQGFQQGFTESQARPLLYEKVSGKDALTPEGARGFVGRAMEAPTYLYAGTKGFLGNPAGNLGSRILSRSTAVLPEAGVNTALQQFEQGDLKNAPSNFARNALAMALLSNLSGEAGRAIRGKKNIAQTGGTHQSRVEQTLSQGQGTIQPVAPQTGKTAQLRRLGQPSDFVDSSYTPKVAQTGKNFKPLQEGGKQRGFIESIKKSPELSEDLASRVEGVYDPIRNRPMQEKAQRLIFDNINEAERIARENIGPEGVITGNELVKHYDEIAKSAKASGDMATFNQSLDKASDLVKTQARKLTEAGQTVQAASTISKMSPEGVLHYVNKVAKDAGTDLKLSNEKTFDFMRKAEEIQNILDPRERAFKTFDLIDDITENIPRGNKDKLLEALNLPRSIMATADLSAPFRQGIFVAARNPKMFAQNFGKMFKYAFSEKAYRNFKADIITSPNYNLYRKYKLPLTDTSAGLSGREEQFMSQLAEKVPLFGKLAKGSNRAYTGFLNKMRVDLFDDFVKTAKLNNITDSKFFEDAATFVGSATGRGKLGRFEDAAKLLNTTFFSPRLMASRMNLINPLYYAKLHPVVRKEALKSLTAFVGTGMSVLALAKFNGADVSTDPRSADFGKIKIGNTRYDIWGGFQQYARLIGQLTTGEKISTTTGKQTTLGEGYNAPTRESIFMDFLKSKEAPIFSFLTRASQGEKFGEKFNLPAEVISRFIPMIASDAFDLYRERGDIGIPMALPGFFGVGSQTYGDQVPLLTKTKLGNPSLQWRSEPELGETILNKIIDKEITNIPKDQWKPLVEERTAEQKRQIQLDAAKQEVLTTGEPKYVGDTFIFLDDGIVKTKVINPTKRKPLESEIKKSNLPFYTE